MASIFDDLPKIAVESVTQSNLWMPDTEFIKHKLPDQPKPPTGIAIKAPFEKLDHDLYRPAACMVAFRVKSKDRFLLWIKTFAFRYHSQFWALDNYTCKWTDKENTKEGNIEYTDFITQLDQSETKPMKMSTPRIVTPRTHDTVINKQSTENILASLQLLESKLCEVSNTCAGLKDDNPTDNNNYDSKMSELNQNLDDLKGNQQKLEKELHGLVLSSYQMNKLFVSSAVLDKKLVDFEKSILTKINLQRNEITNTVTLKENSDLKKALTNLESSNSKLRTQNEPLRSKIRLTTQNDDMTDISEKIRDEQKVKKDDDNSIPKEKPYSNGKSTVHYMLTSQNLFYTINNFMAKPPTDLSDHCLIALNIFNFKHPKEIKKEELWSLPGTFKWTNQSKDIYIDALLEENSVEDIPSSNKLIDDNSFNDIDFLVTKTNEIYLEAAKKSVSFKANF
ncbi:unnamed protein product [Mytilus coruscus]|uniref:Uncharacterized protein n=1 Tax=Mytilus coruscus TaxID=42192 RepID=A0A6J8CNU4_MYTCO|nr:unnamed protein product [Mytilus coruscus]